MTRMETQQAIAALMEQDTSYNGWSNYPTWCVNLWISNDESLYNEAVRITADTLRNMDHPTSEYFTVEQSRRYNVADMLKEWVTDDLTPDLGASFPSDLLSFALSMVDWNEIADSWISVAQDQ